MGITKNYKQTADNPSSELHPRHQQARDFTRKMIEDMLSSNDKSDQSGRAG